MQFGKLFDHITYTRQAKAMAVIKCAASPVICEMLEARWLLSSYVYDVPSGHTAAYLE